MLRSAYDVVVLGGGPAGLAAAISLRRKTDVSVLVVEAERTADERVGESTPPDLVVLLAQLGLADRFRADGHATCPGYASVWGRAAVGYNDFIVSPMGPAWRLDRKAFNRMLAQAAREHGATIVESSRFLHAKRPTDQNAGYVLELLDVEQRQRVDVRARYVVDATGPLARFATNIGIKKHLDDQLFAQIRFADVVSGRITRQTLLEATPTGWWYTALLPENRIITMKVTDKAGMQSLQPDRNRNYENELRSTTFVGPALAQLEVINPSYHTTPIYSSILAQMQGQDWIAAGDAASSFDPVAAQGIYKALSNGVAVGATVARALHNGSRCEDQAYQHSIRNSYAAYLENRAFLYNLEKRWRDAPFWRDRHSATETEKRIPA